MSTEIVSATAAPLGGADTRREMHVRHVRVYGLTLGGILGALGLSTALAPRLVHAPFVFCYVGVALAALYGGLGPALLATVVGIAGISYLILPPTHTMHIERPADVLSIMAFTVVSVAVSSLTRSLRVAVERARRLAHQYEAQAVALTASNAEIRRTSLALDEARRAAETANAAKSRFLGMVSHEIRTPINASLGYADLLVAQVAGPLTDQQHMYVSRILDANRHLGSLVTDILDAVKAESGRLTVDRAPGDLAVPVEQALALVRPHADARGVAVVRPWAGEDPRIPYVGDEDRVRQVLLNLLWNAIKFTDRGGRVEVTCGTMDHPVPEAALRGGRAWAYVRVDDTGCGIAADQLEVVFAPFVQGDTPLARRGGGAGLGLAISRQLARLMGGEVSVRSALGKGSSFTLWLPTNGGRRRPSGI